MASGYTRQFRDQAVKLVTERGYAPSMAARELGMPDSTLVQWLKKAGWKPRLESDPDAALPEDPKALAAQVRELRRQVKRSLCSGGRGGHFASRRSAPRAHGRRQVASSADTAAASWTACRTTPPATATAAARQPHRGQLGPPR